MAKNILKSKTFWFNFVGAIFGVLEKTVLDMGVSDGILVTIVSIGNILLRTLTSTPVTVLPQK